MKSALHHFCGCLVQKLILFLFGLVVFIFWDTAKDFNMKITCVNNDSDEDLNNDESQIRTKNFFFDCSDLRADLSSSSSNKAIIKTAHKKAWVASQNPKGSWSLCSIPEDRNMAPALFLVPRRRSTKRYDEEEDSAYEDDEPIFHRSPVSIENGYRPSNTIYELRFIKGPSCGHEDELETDASSEETTDSVFARPADRRPASSLCLLLNRLICFLHMVVTCLALILCLAFTLVVLLLTSHHFR